MADRALRGNKLTKKDYRIEEVEQSLREALVKGTGKVSKDQKKFRVLTSPPSGSKIPLRIKIPKRGG